MVIKLFSTIAVTKARLTLLTFMILALLVAILPGCATTEEAEPVHLKVVDLPYVAFTTLYIAQEEGYFAEQGLEVEFVKFPSVTQAIPLLVQGDIDVAAGSINASLVNAIAQNMNIRIVAGRDYIDPGEGNMALMVRKDLYDSGELDTVSEIKGKQVAMGCIACIFDFAVSKILENAGLTLNDITVVRMTTQDTIAALENKALEATAAGSLLMGQLKALDYAVTLEPFHELLPDFQVAFMIFGPSLLEDNPDVGKKFMVAYLKGVRQYAQGKTERNLEIAQKYTGMDRETLLQSPWPPIYADGRINVEDVLAFEDWAYENDLIDKKVPSEQLIDTSFVDYANDVLGPVS